MNITNNTPFEVEAIPANGVDSQTYLTVIVKGTFTITQEQPVAVADAQMPIAFGDEYYDPENGGCVKFESDIAPYKPRSDIVLLGHAYAAAGTLAASVDVRLQVGNFKKALRIFGDRYWHCPAFRAPRASKPEPFEKMPIIYERAFGGIDKVGGAYCRENLTGVGFFSKYNKECCAQAPLPNIEDPRQLIKSPEDKPAPAGFAYYGRDWAPRVDCLGTYDENWRKTRSPNPPADFRYDYYNAAHPDLQLDGYLVGDEIVTLYNLTPNGLARFKLPGWTPVCKVERAYDILAAYVKNKAPADPRIGVLQSTPPDQTRVEMNLDTLCLMPDEHRCYIVWRGRIEVFDMTALEIMDIQIT